MSVVYKACRTVLLQVRVSISPAPYREHAHLLFCCPRCPHRSIACLSSSLSSSTGHVRRRAYILSFHSCFLIRRYLAKLLEVGFDEDGTGWFVAVPAFMKAAPEGQKTRRNSMQVHFLLQVAELTNLVFSALGFHLDSSTVYACSR